MRYLILYTSVVPFDGTPDPVIIEGMEVMTMDMARQGHLTEIGGLARRAEGGLRLACRNGKFTVTEGAVADSQVMAATGYAFIEADTREELLARMQRFLDVIGDGTVDAIRVSRTDPVPGAMPGASLVPYLALDGALKASDFYQRAFGAEVVVSQPPDEKGRTMHVQLHLNGATLMLSDVFPEMGHAYKPPAGFTLHLQVRDIEAAWARAVAAGCTVVMPLADMFWGDRYGQLADPFGVTWSLGQAKPD